MELETRICPSCKKSFRVSKTSKQKYDTAACFEFRSGKLVHKSRQEFLNFKKDPRKTEAPKLNSVDDNHVNCLSN